MTKLKNIIAIAVFTFLIYSCGDTNTGLQVDDFDHEAQAIIDQDSLIKFLKNNYYDTSVDSLKTLVAGEQPIYEDSKLQTVNVNYANIDYLMYVYVKDEGNPIPNKSNPTILDSILVNYHLGYFKDSIDYIPLQKLELATWFNPSIIAVEGWLHGFTYFKPGENITNNGPITYRGGGNGIIFIPSGLAYRNIGSGTLPSNANLIYYVNLFDIVEETDHDNDGIGSFLEDVDGDGEPRNDDTDGDLIVNYADSDDDGDGVLTKDEDANGDGNPANDFSDPNNPTLPDYLNPDIN
jgi:FKBP-type peptidyl-prolyl cis-trans isomerase FkpA